MNEKIFNGSQKHILEWISHENFLESFNNLMSDSKVSINTKEYLKPKSLNDYTEYNISSYCKENYKKFEFLKNGIDFAKWWAPKGGKLPTWDLISICDINNQFVTC